MNGQRRVRAAPDVEALADQAAKIVVGSAREALAARPIFSVALSGGNTPRPLYQRLASEPYRSQIDWHRVQIFFSDERFVPPDSPESNYRMVHEALLSRVPIPDSFVHRVATVDIAPEASALLYDENIRRVFEIGQAGVARFDLILLGLGGDGHTASLFPGTDALDLTDHMVAANFVPAHDSWRITFTYPVLNAARRVLFLVSGQDKAEVVGRVLSGDAELPASRVHPSDGELIWLLEKAAASRLPEGVVSHEL